MVLEQGLFTVAEGDNEEQLFLIADDDDGRQPIDLSKYQPSEPKPQPQPSGEEKPPKLPVYPQEVQPQPSFPPKATPAADDQPKGWRESKDVKQFTQFLMDEMDRIGNPAGWRTESEKRRGLGQLNKLNTHLSQALREDYDSILDLDHIEKARSAIEKHIDDVEYALDGMSYMRKQRKNMRRRRADDDPDLVKEATAPHFNGMQINISAFERAIVGALLNGRASGGRDIEELYVDAKKKYDITDREELAIFQILADMGLPTFKDRLRFGENEDPTREEGFGEWQSQYYG